MHPLAALVVVLTVVLMVITMLMVSRARSRHGIKAPATVGNPDFERVFRVQMNTLEQSVMFLPLFVVATQVSRNDVAIALGAVWLIGRAIYIAGYTRAADRRALGFFIAIAALALLLLQCLWGITWNLLLR
jgi:glutathione S-transferase